MQAFWKEEIGIDHTFHRQRPVNAPCIEYNWNQIVWLDTIGRFCIHLGPIIKDYSANIILWDFILCGCQISVQSNFILLLDSNIFLRNPTGLQEYTVERNTQNG